MKRKQFILTACMFCLALLMLTVAASAEETETAELMGTFEGAAAINVNEEQTGAILSKNDNYYYLIDLPSDGNITISFRHDYVETDDDLWRVRLYTYNDIEHTMFDKVFKGSERDEDCTPTVGLPAGRYYVYIGAYNEYHWSNVTFHFTVNYRISDTWEKEWNNSLANATSIPLNQEINGCIMKKEESDYYIIDLPSDGNITIAFNHNYVETDEHLWRIRLYTYHDTEHALFDNVFKGNERNEDRTPTVGLPAGQYYIYIGDYNEYHWSTAAYRFTVFYETTDTWEKEWNNTFSNATSIPLNQEISGCTMKKEEGDYYIVDIPSDGTISISFNHNYVETDENLWRIRLYTYNDIEHALFGNVFKGSERKEVLTPTVGLPAGQYYIYIGDYSEYHWSTATYRFTVNYAPSDAWEKENNGSRLSATQVYFNKEIRGSSMKSDDSDFYVFTLAKDDNVSFSFGHDYVDDVNKLWNLSLYNDSDINKSMHSTDFIGTEKNNLTTGEFALSAGTYYLCISAKSEYHWSTVPYTLTVNAKSQEGTPQPFVQKYIIDGITVSNTNGKALNAIPDKDFLATVTVTNLTGGGESWILLASYTKEGQFVDFTWARTKNFSVGGTFDLTVPIRNPSGKIGQLKAFTVSSLSNLTPLGNSASFPAV